MCQVRYAIRFLLVSSVNIIRIQGPQPEGYGQTGFPVDFFSDFNAYFVSILIKEYLKTKENPNGVLNEIILLWKEDMHNLLNSKLDEYDKSLEGLNEEVPEELKDFFRASKDSFEIEFNGKLSECIARIKETYSKKNKKEDGK